MQWVPQGIELAADILSRIQGTVLVYYDPDVDGVYSGKFVCSVLDMYKIPYERYINQNRQHGFFYPDVSKLHNRTVIAVDFSIPSEKLQILAQNNVRLINIDHHAIEDNKLVTYTCPNSNKIDGVVINNQYSFEPESKRYLSGAGVVFYVFANLVKGFDCELSRALVGLTLLSDIRPIENKEAEVFLRACYTCKHPYMTYLVNITKAEKDYSFGVPRMERNYIDYTFSPKLNALFRLNMGDVAMDLVDGKPPKFKLDEAKKIQSQVVDYIQQKIVSPFNTNNLLDPSKPGVLRQPRSFIKPDGTEGVQFVLSLSDLDIFFMPNEEISPTYKLSNFIGLTCSRLKGNGKSTVAYIGSNVYLDRGSFRGRFDNINYLELFGKYGFPNCAGHHGAFGINTADIRITDFVGLNAEIAELEREAEKQEYANRIVPVSNLAMFVHSDILKQMAMTNLYVRDGFRMLIQYTGTNASRHKVGKMFEFNIDGITVKCFDDNITTQNGYILPIYDRGVLTFYLKNIRK